MYVRALAVTDFRSWEQAELALEPGVSVLVGANGQGKTNLVEALGYLSTLGSHRVASDAPLVRRGAASAIVRVSVVNDARELSVELEINPGRANRARVNRAPVRRARDILGILRTVLFAPEDLALVRGDPAERRRFLDELLVARAPRWAGIRSDYERVLRQRSALLRTARSVPPGGARPGAGTLDVWDAHLARHGAALLAGRLRLVTDLAPYVAAAYAAVAPDSVPVAVGYHASVPEVGGPGARSRDGVPGGLDGACGADEAGLEKALLAELVRLRPVEVERGACLVGPHRDDLDLRLGEGPARGYASHGEAWALALALRLGCFELLRAHGVDPVLLLDDVFAELDTRRRAALAAVALRAEQVLVTAAVEADVPAALAGTRFRVGDGEVRCARSG